MPHADPKLCPIVHIAAALGNREIDPAYELFAEGFTHKPGQDYVSFATMVQRRYIAILQCAAVAIGVPALFAEKKLHAFRVQCTNVMGSKGATEAEREANIYASVGVHPDTTDTEEPTVEQLVELERVGPTSAQNLVDEISSKDNLAEVASGYRLVSLNLRKMISLRLV